MKNSGIYMIRSKNDPNQFYIGSTCNLKRRGYWINRTDHRPKLESHIKKYGENDLEFFVLEYCSNELLYQREQYYISELQPSLNSFKFASNHHDKYAYLAKKCFCKDLANDELSLIWVSDEPRIMRYCNRELIPEILIPLNI